MRAATHPAGDTRTGRLLVVGAHGISHRRPSDLPSLLRGGDLVVANDAATLPASLAGHHVPTGAPIEVRLAGRASLAPDAVRTFTAVVFGEGDYRTPTEARSLPPPLAAGDRLVFGSLRGRVLRVAGHPRLIELRFEGPIGAIWRGLAVHGRPIQYAYVPGPLALWDTWTRVAGPPVAFEAPSAGFVLDWSMLGAIRSRGAAFATLTHAAGISSTGDPALDEQLPFDEPYSIPLATAALIDRARREGRRVIAIGTTVVRALEDAADKRGRVRSGEGVARHRLGPHSTLCVCDAIVSGVHEPGTSHWQLLRAFADDSTLGQALSEAERHDYAGHEFGDFVFVERRRG